MEPFGTWLLKELTKQSMSQADLARASGITTAHMSRIISGERNAGKDALAKIAYALRLPPETVFIAAGIYKPTYTKDDEKDPTLLEWIKIFKDADDETRERLIDSARYFASRGAQRQ